MSRTRKVCDQFGEGKNFQFGPWAEEDDLFDCESYPKIANRPRGLVCRTALIVFSFYELCLLFIGSEDILRFVLTYYDIIWVFI